MSLFIIFTDQTNMNNKRCRRPNPKYVSDIEVDHADQKEKQAKKKEVSRKKVRQ
jgi:hypothetical protein